MNGLNELLIIFISLILFNWIFLPARFKQDKQFPLYLFGFLLLGPFGIFILLLHPIFLKFQKPSLKYKHLEFSEFRVLKYFKRSLGEAAVLNPDERFIYYLINIGKASYLKILKKFLKSKNDEFRLLTFTYLEKKEKEILEHIKNYLVKVNSAPRFFYNLGKMYWELVYSSIVDEELEKIYLEKAKLYLENHLRYFPYDERSLFLLGRIYHRNQKFNKALFYYQQSLDFGFPPERILPYMIECLFKLGRRDEILKLRREVSYRPLASDLKTNSMLRVWL
jgi:tetratricopeptide (TPR) repeat protein